MAFVVVLVVSLAVNCGDGGEAGDDEARDAEADRALAEIASLDGADVGPEWVDANPDEGFPDWEDFEVDIVEEAVGRDALCERWLASGGSVGRGDPLVFSYAFSGHTAIAEAIVVAEPNYTRRKAQVLFVYPTADAARAAVDALDDVGFGECIGSIFDDVLQAIYDRAGSGWSVAQYRYSEYPVEAGDAGFGLRVEFDIETEPRGGGSFDADVSATAVGRVVNVLSQESHQPPLEAPAITLGVAIEKIEDAFG